MLYRIVQLIAFLSLAFYFCAPESYSYSFNLLCFLLYLVSSVAMLLNNCKYTYVKYELFFTIAFIFTNFIYTTFYYNSDVISIISFSSFMPQYFNKGVAMSLVGGSFFNLGVYDKNQSGLEQSISTKKQLYVPRIIIIILMMLFLPYLYALSKMGEYVTEFEGNTINTILICFIYYSLFSSFNNASRKNGLLRKFRALLTIPNFLIIMYVALFLIIGSRTFPLRIMLIAFFLFDFMIKKINKKVTIITLFAGVVLMAMIRFARTESDMDGVSLLNFGDDLIGCNRCLHYIMDYVSKNGYTFGSSMIITFITIIPHGGSIFMEMTGVEEAYLYSASLVTKFYGQTAGVGLGTALIGDVYLAFGIIGVFSMLYLLGRIVKVLYQKSVLGSIPCIFLYALFFMDAVYINRSMFFVSVTFIAWSYFLYILFNKYRKKKSI